MDSSEAIQQALQYHQAGRLADAEAIYRDILRREPHHADALQLLGTIAGQRGQMDMAIDLMRRSIAVRPDYVPVIRNLGALLAQAGRLEESVETYRRILAIAPSDPEALNDLGSVLLRMDQVDEAIDCFRRATKLEPGFAEAFRNLSYALRKKGRNNEALAASSRAVQLQPNRADGLFEQGQCLAAAARGEEALAAFRGALQYQPGFADAENNIGKILAEMGRLDEAISVYAGAISRHPNNALLHLNLGNALSHGDRTEEAIAAYSAAAQAQPDYMEAHTKKAMALAKLQRFEEAMASQAQAAALKPDAAATHEAMGEILLRQMDAKGAEEHFGRACAVDPGSGDARIGLGRALEALGRFDEAQAAFREALELRPDLVGVYQSLVRSGRFVAQEAEINRLTEILEQPNVRSADRAAAEFALGNVLDEADRFDNAFAHFVQANQITMDYRSSAGERYDPEEFRDFVDQIIGTNTRRYFEVRSGWGEPSELPVFVVGMPRSGTTLIHQIAASHPAVHGAGERNDIQRVGKALGGEDPRSAALGWRRESIAKAAAELLQRYRSLNEGALRIVDKQPGNVSLLGLISLLFPGARIILSRRDARDNCLSCYFQNFATGNLFSYDLAHCGLHQMQVYRLMDYWPGALPIRLMEVHYEQVVADLEGQARRIIDFLGLPWDPACLAFQKSKAAVLTASAWQVRQPIYSRSVGRWRSYEKHLGALLGVLGNG